MFLRASLAQPATQASPGFFIEGQIKGSKDTTLILAHWYGKISFTPKDTAKVDNQGTFVFSGKEPLPQGLYLLVRPSNQDVGLHLIITEDQ
ncbi:hypothetical protein GCM10027592_61790 [Spirosoma flavus]